MKNYVQDEYTRNKNACATYEQLLKLAFGKDAVVIVSHHIIVKPKVGDTQEIPSADTILFDPTIMGLAFGAAKAKAIAIDLAMMQPEQREPWVQHILDRHQEEVMSPMGP
jgi:hypothetical protein